MKTNITNILLRHNYIPVAESGSGSSQAALASVMMNLSYYGYALNIEAYEMLSKLNSSNLISWWELVEKELKEITGDSKNIGDFVVYKNFPAEVLDKTESEYWLPQILMYWGFPSSFFTEKVEPRANMNEQPRPRVLKRASKETISFILNSLLSAPARWKDQELEDVLLLAKQSPIDMSKLAFKENLIKVATVMMQTEKEINIATATDVLRLAAGLSDGDISLREKVKFISFKKKARRFLLNSLENCKNLSEDVARRPELWKRLLHQLHPGDYKNQYPRVCSVMNDLYKDQLTTFASEVENLLLKKDTDVLQLLSDRPGEFRRRLVHLLNLFGDQAAEAFVQKNVLNKLTTMQIVSLRTLLATITERKHRVFPPKGNWNKLQIGEPRLVTENQVSLINNALGNVLKERLPKIKFLDETTKFIKLPTGGDVSTYTRGTVFPIPDEVNFIRTASYWKNDPKKGTTWFDNGWNFFDKDWKALGSCCWNAISFGQRGAIFSGDPVNSGEMKGRAAQLIDLYPSSLISSGVRYAVWNILCYSRIAFADAEDVFAALQWGQDAQSGKLFEPSRCQLSFPLKSKQMTKFVCSIDLEKREMTYLDANLHGEVSSASMNNSSLAKNMPAFMDYLKSLPSVYDLFSSSIDKESDKYVLYSDRNIELNNVSAYVFKPENKLNKFTSLDINKYLS